jgi:hypothetical protein
MEQTPSQHNNPFDFIPIELTQLILGMTGKWAGIVEWTCKSWFSIIRSQHPDHPPKLFVCCVVHSIPLLQWARHNGCPWNCFLSARAAREGHIDVLEWLFENGCPWGDGVGGTSAA